MVELYLGILWSKTRADDENRKKTINILSSTCRKRGVKIFWTKEDFYRGKETFWSIRFFFDFFLQ